MNLADVLTRNKFEEDLATRIFGAVVGLVTNIDDPDGQGRVKVSFPWLQDDTESSWARVVSFMAGNSRGAVFRPETGDEVLVLFEHGDVCFPYVIGAVWNGQDALPSERGADRDNNIRLIKSRSGHTVILDDTQGSEKIEIKDKTGKNSILWDATANTITIATEQDIVLSAPKGKISLDAQEISITSSGDAKMEATGTTNVKGATVNIN